MIINRLILHNFKSYAHAEIDFGLLTTATGASNHGKTNIFRALRVLMHNGDWPDRWIRHNQKEAYIEGHFESGYIIRRSRTKTGQSVTITDPQGVVVPYVGKADASEIIERITSVHKITIDDSKGPQDLNFIGVNSPFHLVGLRPDITLRVVTAIVGASKLEQVKTRISKKIQRTKDSLKQQTDQLGKVQTQLEDTKNEFIAIDTIFNLYLEQLEQYDVITSCEDRIALVRQDEQEKLERQIANANSQWKTLTQAIAALSTFNDKVRIQSGIEEARNHIGLLESTILAVTEIHAQNKQLICPVCNRPYLD